VLLLCALLAVPVVSAALEGPPPTLFERPRPVAAGSLWALDRLGGVPNQAIPRAREHFAGLAFVRCTGLWVGEPDGSNARKVLAMGGISAPAFSGDGRSIAFVRTTSGEQSLWVVAADGSDARELGRITDAGFAVSARVTGLAWSPKDDKIAFALVDGTYGPLTGGSAVWLHDISSGKFRRVRSGLPTPAWWGRRLMTAGGDGRTPDVQLQLDGGGRRIENRAGSGYDDLAAAVAPLGWYNGTRNEIAVLRAKKKGLHLAVRTGSRDRVVVRPPAGYHFARYSQPTMTQDGARVAIDLLDPGAGRDLGIFDPETRDWDIHDYAWDPSASPVPTLLGRLTRQEARAAAEMLVSLWNRADRTQMLTEGHVPLSVFRWKRFGWALQDPYREAGAWIVPATAYSYGAGDEPYEYRTADIVVRRQRGRLTATPANLGPITRVETLADAHAFAESVIGDELPGLPTLPAGTSLASRYALSASSWTGSTEVTINTTTPRSATSPRAERSFSFGERLGFALGCGGAVDPDPVEVSGGPAMADRSGTIRQVIWPATPQDPTGRLSIHGDVSRDELLELAEEMGVP